MDTGGEILLALIASRTDYREDGHLIWVTVNGRPDLIGKEVGSVSSSDGYRYAKVKGKRVGVHRVVFYKHHGWCPAEVDHENRIRTDNRIGNLRDPESHVNNLGNQSLQVGRSSKFKGVTWDRNRNKWIASLKVDRRTVFLGRFTDETCAAKAYNQAAGARFGKFANLNEVEQ